MGHDSVMSKTQLSVLCTEFYGFCCWKNEGLTDKNGQIAIIYGTLINKT
jgi:hypothetical protein